ncbi:hypothetical protein HPG69_001177, partial [Diceros bicornis minor]
TNTKLGPLHQAPDPCPQRDPCWEAAGQPWPLWELGRQIRDTHQRASLSTFWEIIPMTAEPLCERRRRLRVSDKARQGPQAEIPFEEGKRRAPLLKKWSLYKQWEHDMEKHTIRSMLEAQQEEAVKQDPSLFLLKGRAKLHAAGLQLPAP